MASASKIKNGLGTGDVVIPLIPSITSTPPAIAAINGNRAAAPKLLNTLYPNHTTEIIAGKHQLVADALLVK